MPTNIETALMACGGPTLKVVFSFNLSLILCCILSMHSILFSMGIEMEVGGNLSLPLKDIDANLFSHKSCGLHACPRHTETFRINLTFLKWNYF